MTEDLYSNDNLTVSLVDFNEICHELGYDDGSKVGTFTTAEHNSLVFYNVKDVVKNDKYSYMAIIEVDTLLTPPGIGIPHGYIEQLRGDAGNRVLNADVRIARVPRDNIGRPSEAFKEQISLVDTPLTRDKFKKWIDTTCKKLLKKCKSEKFEQQFTTDF